RRGRGQSRICIPCARHAAAGACRGRPAAMLNHGTDAAELAKRVVVMGAGGFVGNAIATRLERDGVPVLRLGRRDLDLLAAGAAEKLAAMFEPGDVLVAVSALAPVRNPAMLRDNMIMAAAMVEAAA